MCMCGEREKGGCMNTLIMVVKNTWALNVKTNGCVSGVTCRHNFKHNRYVKASSIMPA